MKKAGLIKIKPLMATDNMLQQARSDLGEQKIIHRSYGPDTRYTEYKTFLYFRARKQETILEICLYTRADLARRDRVPRYRIFLDRDGESHATYECAEGKWRTAKIDSLSCGSRMYYVPDPKPVASESTKKLINNYCRTGRLMDVKEAILDFQSACAGVFEYQDIKNNIKTKLNETVNNFVIIGFYLKLVRDNMLYTQDGYKNMEEFARGEYNLSPSTASRFMDINTRFSEGGNSQVLKMEYSNYGYSKLQEMLTVRDEDLTLITEDTTVKQIRELKSLEKQEEKAEKQEAQNNLPIVQMTAVEETEEDATSQEDPFHEVMIEYWRNRVEILKQVHNNMISPEDLADELCPSGSKTFYHGIYMIFLYDINGGIKVRYYKDGKAQIDTYTYVEWIDKTNSIVNDEIFNELTKPVQKEEPELVVEQKPKKEWKELKVEVTEQKKEKVPVPEVVTRKAEDLNNKPLPGQMTTNDIPELNENSMELAAVAEEGKEPEVIDAEYREIKQREELPTVEELKNTIEFFAEQMRDTNKLLAAGLESGVQEAAISSNTRNEIVLRALRYCIRQQEA